MTAAGQVRRSPGAVAIAPHPLENFVLRAFQGREAHDGSSIGYLLGNAPRGGRLQKAYRLVALDVLDHMVERGILLKDWLGWYVINGAHPWCTNVLKFTLGMSESGTLIDRA